MTDDEHTEPDRRGVTAGDLRGEDDELEELAGEADTEARRSIKPAFRSVEEWEWLDDDHDTPDRRPLLTDPDTDDLWLPRGKVGMVAAPGGTGKTRALLQLAIAVATGRDWLGTYEVESPGHVVCALAETAPEDFDRILNATVDELDLNDDEREDLREHLWALPLDGRPVGLMEDPTRKLRMYQRLHDGVPSELRNPDGTPDLDALYYTDKRDEWEQLLEDRAPDDGWRLIILDPASRFIGPDVEKDNAAATRFVELLESWKNKPDLEDGNGVGPTVLISHHVNKRSTDDPIEMLYRQGAARGSSALTDGVRWQLNMNAGHVEEQNGELTEFVVMRAAKSNHGRKGGVTWLIRTPDGVLEHHEGTRGELLGPADVADRQQDDQGSQPSSGRDGHDTDSGNPIDF